jgi:hypothetical protein
MMGSVGAVQPQAAASLAPGEGLTHRSNDALGRHAVRNQTFFHRKGIPGPIPARGLCDVWGRVSRRHRAEKVGIIGAGKRPGDVNRALRVNAKQLAACGLDSAAGHIVQGALKHCLR